MSEVQRICPQCGETGPLAARYCPHCGHDREALLPVQQSNFPLVLAKAALPLLAGVASLALRAGWKLLQSRVTGNLTEKALASLRTSQPPARTGQASGQSMVQPPVTKPRRTIHIRSAWAVTDGNGVRRSGVSEHQIDIDD